VTFPKKIALLIASACIVLTAKILAQPGPPPDPDIPITGIEILVGVGSLLGTRYFMTRAKKNRD